MLVDAMPGPTSSNFFRRVFPAGLFLLAGLVASCSGDDPAPLQPGPDPAPSRMFSIVGDPRVSVRFSGSLREASDSTALTGSFTAVITDSTTVPTFLEEVRLDGVLMTRVVDAFGSPVKYTLDALALPPLSLDDTLRFQVVDGGAITPPFTYVIAPPRLELPPDGTILRNTGDITLKWNGAVERVQVTLTDIQGRRLRYSPQVSSMSGKNQLVIMGSDLVDFAIGSVLVGTDVLDDELMNAGSSTPQSVSVETRQSRVWRHQP
jgi:hypothetical protein